MTSFVCKCEKLCANYDEFHANHVDTISSWGERIEVHDAAEQQRQKIEQMIRDEPFARRRRAEKARKIAAGYVPKPQPRCEGPKPICNKCVVNDGKIVASNCCNPKCTFVHGKFDRRAEVRMAAE